MELMMRLCFSFGPMPLPTSAPTPLSPMHVLNMGAFFELNTTPQRDRLLLQQRGLVGVAHWVAKLYKSGQQDTLGKRHIERLQDLVESTVTPALQLDVDYDTSRG